MSARDIWSILEIPETEDEAAIRRAYAVQLRQTNPEDDAEGFKRLRHAYDAALQHARWMRQEREWQEQQRRPETEDDDPAADDWDDNEEPHDVLADPALNLAVHDGVAPSAETLDETALLRGQIQADIDLHVEARNQLAEAIREGGSREHLLAALEMLLATRAMGQLDIYESTSAWLIGIVHQCRPVADVLIEPMIAFFGWTPTVQPGQQWNGPQSVLSLKRWIEEEDKAKAYLARITDRRHEFHRAWRETRRSDTEFAPRMGLARAWALRRLSLMERFLSFTEHKFPAAFEALDPGAVDWWRTETSRKGFSLSLARHLSGFNILSYTVVAFLVIIVALAFDKGAYRSEQPRLDRKTHAGAREICREEARRWRPAADPAARNPEDPRGLAAALNECQNARALIPESFMVRQYAAIIELKRGDKEMALAYVSDILTISPADPVALYIKGLAYNARDPDSSEGRKLMQEALHLDENVDDRLRAFHVTGLPDVSPAKKARDFFVMRLNLPHDVNPVLTKDATQQEVDEAYRYLGMEALEGKAVLECLVRSSGSLSDCRIMSETPANRGIGELAIRISAARLFTPATKSGVPVDGLPIRLPYTFVVNAAKADAAVKPSRIDFLRHDEEATGIVENELADSLAEAAVEKKPAIVRARFVDLDNDGAPEIIARMESPYICGDTSRTCFYVMRVKPEGGVDIVYSRTGVDKVETVASAGGRVDLRIDDTSWSYWP